MPQTNRDPDVEHDQLDQLWEFRFAQDMKLNYHSSIPGVVREYDAETKRARVQIALNMILIDGAKLPRPIILDVPVIHPSGGGYVIHLPLVAGDAVMLVFSERGIENFKKTFAVADPTLEGLWSERDAVAFPGFGALGITPATETGLSIQAEDGTHYINLDDGDLNAHLTEGDVNVHTDDGDMSVDTDEGDVTVRTRDGAININADGGDVTINVEGSNNVHVGGQGGQELATKEFVMLQYNLHKHASPAGPTGPPITPAPMTPGGDITEKTKAE